MNLNKYNRIKSKQPVSDGEFWCWKCDRCVVSMGAKCRSCGALNGHKTRKKQEVVDFDLEFAQ